MGYTEDDLIDLIARARELEVASLTTDQPDVTWPGDLHPRSRERATRELIREGNNVRDLDGTGLVGRMADMLGGWLTDVRPVTEEWECGWHTGSEVEWLGDRAAAERHAAKHHDGPQIIGYGDWGSRYVRRRPAGPWEPVPSGEAARG